VGIATAGFRSKSWDECTAADAPPLSVVITVCDSAAAEACPVFFGGATQPIKTHWGDPDPSNADGGDEGKRRAFELTRQAIGYRMLQLLELLRSPAWTSGAADPAARAERHGAMTGIMKAQIDWIPLRVGAVRPTQGKTLAVMEVSGGSQSFNAVNQMRIRGRWMRMITIPNQSSVAKAFTEFDEAGRMKPGLSGSFR
jgi:hypothetical protein